MHEEAVLCECVFLDVTVTISRATSTLVYEWPRIRSIFTLVFEIWCAHMEVSAGTNHKLYVFDGVFLPVVCF